MKKLCILMWFVLGGLLLTSGCESENEKYMKETPEVLKTPTTESRSGPEETFLPPRPEGE